MNWKKLVTVLVYLFGAAVIAPFVAMFTCHTSSLCSSSSDAMFAIADISFGIAIVTFAVTVVIHVFTSE